MNGASRRIDELVTGFEAHRRKHTGGSEQQFPGGAYVALHSLSHALMMEIALECGYPSSSLKERIYAFQPPRDGPKPRMSVYDHPGSDP